MVTVLLTDFYPRPPRGGRRAGITSHKQGILISIHALREEGDQQITPPTRTASQFLSTPSARRATNLLFVFRYCHDNFYPRPPRGGRRTSKSRMAVTIIFLSTPSARRATWVERLQNGIEPISIHALREEGDINFRCLVLAIGQFLSTPSARRATPCRRQRPRV